MIVACAVCGLMGTGESGWAYFAGSAALSLLPLMMIGGISWWLYRRVKNASQV